jgi:hypothetical protein
MKKLLIIPLLLLSLSLGATKVYVATTGNDGTGDGTSGNPYLTIATGITNASAGDTVYIVAGTYNVSTQIVVPVGISIMGEGISSKIVTTYTNGSAVQAAIQLASTAGTPQNGNQTISYIELNGSSYTSSRAIQVSYRNNVEIHHCTIKDFNYSGIWYYVSASYPSVFLTGCHVHDCEIINCTSYIGAASYTGSIRLGGTDGTEISNNILINTGRTGEGQSLYFIRNKRHHIHDNKLYRDDTEIAGDGTYYWNFYLEEWDYKGGAEYHDNKHFGLAKLSLGGEFNEITDGETFGYKVYNNLFYGEDWGPRLVNGTDEDYVAITIEGDGHNEVYIYNNYIEKFNVGVALSTPSSGTGYWHHDWDWDGIYVYGNIIKEVCYKDFTWSSIGIWWINNTNDPEYDGDFRNINIYNNTITGGNSGTYRGYHGIGVYANETVTNVNIKNNLIYNFAQYGISFTEDASDSLVLTNLAINYNNLYECGSSNSIYLEPEGSGRVYSNINITTGNITVEPLFKSNETFRLRPSSLCIDAGIDVGLTHDYWGHRVPQNGTPDIGAHEYGNYLVRLPSGNFLRTANGKLILTH